ncbi:hypothetical protein C474_17399 [Halogeometricum pallidum JCM 14848]|uniref:DUF8108 domain-containing protein n=1 Tax=Halogeometricum pallidum JCM 14848 TaxID=1227487 RepID=M0CV70_HALPD|nr:hypothetical protein [Halogeometricum pallidum]ELZ27146.1 hypothetical protein C474_17399 [Halogeometricum pallidum JCM 14848]
MPPPTLLSGTLRRLTVAVSLLTSALFALLAGALAAGALGVPAGTALTAVVAALAFLPVFWLHCYAAGYVAYAPTEFGAVRRIETLSAQVTACTVCGDSDANGVCRRYGEQRVVAGVPLATTEEGENWYCGNCHAVEHGDGGSAPDATVDRALEETD